MQWHAAYFLQQLEAGSKLSSWESAGLLPLVEHLKPLVEPLVNGQGQDKLTREKQRRQQQRKHQQQLHQLRIKGDHHLTEGRQP